MFAARLRNAAPFLSAGIAAGSAVLLGYHACYGTGNAYEMGFGSHRLCLFCEHKCFCFRTNHGSTDF